MQANAVCLKNALCSEICEKTVFLAQNVYHKQHGQRLFFNRGENREPFVELKCGVYFVYFLLVLVFT